MAGTLDSVADGIDEAARTALMTALREEVRRIQCSGNKPRNQYYMGLVDACSVEGAFDSENQPLVADRKKVA